MAVDPYIGRELGVFVVRERIGQGGMAVVYRAYQHAVNRDVALKIIQLSPDAQDLNHFQQRFTQEAELVASLEHIHILPVYDYGITAHEAYLAMRLLPGGTLRDVLAAGEPINLDRAAEYLSQISKGLAYAHSKNVIHRDIKPANIMLDDAGNVLLADFGLAKIVGDSAEITRTGTIVGTPLYMSPEQLRGETLDHRADIYSLGVILYQMVTGRTPFGSEHGDLVSTIYQQLERAPKSPRTYNSLLSRDAEDVILRALAKDRANRYPSAIEMREDFFLALGRSPSGLAGWTTRPSRPQGITRILRRERRQRWRRRTLLAAGLVIASAVLVLLILAGLRVFNDHDGHLDTPLYVPTIMAGATGLAADIAPDVLQVERARAALGPDGFIGYITCTLDTDYHATQAREIRELATRYKLPLRMYDSDTDQYRAITQLEKARADGATGLIVCPVSPSALANALEAIHQAGLPLVLLESNVPSYGGVKVSGDDYTMGLAAGRFAGEYIRDEMGGQAQVYVLSFEDMPSLVVRTNGLIDGLHEFAPDAVVVGEGRGGTPELGEESVRAALEAGQTFNVILSINDAGSFGAISALETAGLTPDDVRIFSIDAEITAQTYIAEGEYIRGSLAINRAAFSRLAVDVMVELLAGGTVPETVVVPPGEMVTQASLAAGVPE